MPEETETKTVPDQLTLSPPRRAAPAGEQALPFPGAAPEQGAMQGKGGALSGAGVFARLPP